MRQRLFPEPWYRLCHGEGDFLPGLVIDRYGEHCTLQISTAGMESRIKPGESVSIDGKMLSVQQVEQMKEDLAPYQLQVNLFGDPLKNIWKDRPSMPDAPAFIYDVKYAGKSCGEKVAAIRAELKKKGIYALFLSSLDEIAWTLNLRGSDVHCNPVT